MLVLVLVWDLDGVALIFQLTHPYFVEAIHVQARADPQKSQAGWA